RGSNMTLSSVSLHLRTKFFGPRYEPNRCTAGSTARRVQRLAVLSSLIVSRLRVRLELRTQGEELMNCDRRQFAVSVAAIGTSAFTLQIDQLLAASPRSVFPARSDDKDKPEEEVGATEDLMREHGVLNRVILIYEEGVRRLGAREDIGPEVFHRSATLVRKF